MTKIFLFILLASFISCSITRTVDVASYNQHTQKILDQAEKGVRRVQSDFLNHENILAKWGDSKSRQSLTRLQDIQRNLMQNYIRLQEDFNSSRFLQTEELTSKDKDFSAFNSQKENFEMRLEGLDKQFDKYRSESNNLNAYLESKRIYKVDPRKMREDFVNALNESKREQLKVKNDLMDLNVKMNESSLSPEEKKKQKEIIQELVKIVEKIENETFRLQRLFNLATQEINKGVVFVTPGMKAYGYQEKITSYKTIVQNYIGEFNLKSKMLTDSL